MKVFSSWSGGKDCMLALYRMQKSGQHQISYLVNMCDAETDVSRSHGIKKGLIVRQAKAINISLIQQKTGREDYEQNFKSAILKLKEEGVMGGVFGDIYLWEHRHWIERVCTECGVEAIFPLWDNPVKKLAAEIILEGFKTLTVSANAKNLTEDFLGREYDSAFVAELAKLDEIDICAELGEFHTFVYDGPNFRHPVPFKKGPVSFRDNHWFLEII
ncbi:MAG TPA: diphthine--ammonia ligase [Prolixibacteraceae bacterium]|nr:diphthine--ammonia ligase [Prolixibacteraceae bacterium]